MRIGRVKAGVAASLLAGAPLLVLQATPAAAAPALVVEPSTDLVDGQSVTVRGTGFPAGASIASAQCGPGGEGTASDCDLGNLTSTTTDATGSFTLTLRVRRVISTPVDGRIDCATAPPGSCLVVANQFGSGPTASAPVTFDPDVPPLPALELGFELISAAVEDNVVLLQGVLRCNRPSFVYVQGRVRQVVGRAFIDGGFFVEAQCDGEEPFSAVFEGRTGELRRGPAELAVELFGDDGDEFTSVTIEQDIRLAAK